MSKISFLSKEFGIKWIYQVPKETWLTALSILNQVSKVISNQTETYSVTIRNDNRKRLSIIVGQRVVFGFTFEKELPKLIVYTSKNYQLDRISDYYNEFEGEEFKLVEVGIEDWDVVSKDLLEEFNASVVKFLSTIKNGKQKANHNDLFNSVISESSAQVDFINFISLSPQERLIKAYGEYLNTFGLEEELYKWELAKSFKEKFDLEAEDFSQILRSIRTDNLLANQAASFLSQAKKNPEEARAYYQLMFDESKSINERLSFCKKKGDELIKKWHPGWDTSGQDERTLSVFWSFTDNEKHAPYKNSYYSALCEYLGLSKKKAGNKYEHYMEIINSISNEYLSAESVVVKFHNEALKDSKYIDDPKYYFLIQNMLYRVLDVYWNQKREDVDVSTEDVSTKMKREEPMMTIQAPLNQILFGPPGTGKTYTLKSDYFPRYTSNETSVTLEKHTSDIIEKCSWWEVIGMALIDSKINKVSEILDHEWVRIKSELSESKNVRATVWGNLQTHTVEECDLVKYKNRINPLIFTKSEDSTWEILIDRVENEAPELLEIVSSIRGYTPNPNKEIKRYVFTTFHQSFSYEDFIEGIKPIISDDENGDLGYRIEDGVFKKLCQKATKDPGNRYAIFIDEINRGNVSAIFGELITLIEHDKRKGAANQIEVELPYSKNMFSVPMNIDIYGTMNTADRSVEALDTALRRRFSFKEVMPNPSLIKAKVDSLDLVKVLQTINNRIELLIDRDHTIGHAYLINVRNTSDLANAFNDKIVPLLQEYFYGDYGKIGLVLGSGFVEKKVNSNSSFAKFDYEGQQDYLTDSYELISVDEKSVVGAVKAILD